MAYKYDELVPLLRQVGIGATALQLFVLFMESSTLGLAGCFFQSLFLLAECAIFAFNFLNRVDGRSELQLMMRAAEPKEKVMHGLAVFGAFVFGVLVHLCACDLTSGLSTLFFFAGDYVAMGCGFATMCIDVVEGAGGLAKHPGRHE